MFLRMQSYERPTELAEALRLLARPGYRPLGGGTAAVGPVDGETAGLVDLSGLGWQYSRMEHDGLVLGAMMTLGDLLRLPELLLIGGGVLGKAVERTGPPTLLNRATVGGSLAATVGRDGGLGQAAGAPGQVGGLSQAATPHGSPAGLAPDLVTALLALGARVTLARLDTAGQVARETVDLEPYAVAPATLIESVRIPVKPVLAGYERVARTPRDLPAVAVVAAMEQDGQFVQNVRIAAYGLAPTPIRLKAAEEVLEDAAPIEAVIQRAAEAAAAMVTPPADLRGSTEYRRHLARVLTGRAVAAAASRMGRM